MNTVRPPFVLLAAAASLVSLTAGGAFAAWAEHGAEIFHAMAASGLSWCF